METDAVQLILAHLREGEIQLIISPVHRVEISAIANTEERIQLETLLEHLATSVDFDLTQGRAGGGISQSRAGTRRCGAYCLRGTGGS